MLLPVLPLMNVTLFPGMIGPLSLGRPKSQAAVAASLGLGRELAIFTQHFESAAEPGPDDLFPIGVRAHVMEVEPVNERQLRVKVQSLDRVRWRTLQTVDGYLRGECEPLPFDNQTGPETEALMQDVRERTDRLMGLQQKGRFDWDALEKVDWPIRFYLVAANLDLSTEKAQELLAQDSLAAALRYLAEWLQHELLVADMRLRLHKEAAQGLKEQEKTQLLRQELANIHRELGDDVQTDLDTLRDRLEAGSLPEEPRHEAERQLTQLERMTPQASEYQVCRNYVELILDLPWTAHSEDVLDLARARRVLDEDHHGLTQVKERILEHLAVMKLNPASHSPILCFVGPPGTGKTSLGASIARALGRKFERLSLGGMHDESELRGHRRTYVGAMTGRVLQALRRAKVNNPLVMLDEIDKLRKSYEGDPAAALLEVLDPAQNHEFHDNYLDLPFDLSRVFFLTTANTLDTIPGPLLDRMEVIALSGYTTEEKTAIATRHLLPRLSREAGLPDLVIPLETIAAVLEGYTREAGVRQLERSLARLIRRVALQVAEGGTPPERLGPDLARELLGPPDFVQKSARATLEPGSAAGLAYTEAGGDVLYVEVARLPEAEGTVLTGNLGEIMKESARTARSYLLSRYPLEGAAVHIHVPAGATPKDGPSAGLAMACALASSFSGLSARADTAMTGEITLSGLVLPVGGVKEKLLAAQRAGIQRVLLPRANETALSDLPESVTHQMDLVLVDRIEEALTLAIPGFHGCGAPAATTP